VLNSIGNKLNDRPSLLSQERLNIEILKEYKLYKDLQLNIIILK